MTTKDLQKRYRIITDTLDQVCEESLAKKIEDGLFLAARVNRAFGKSNSQTAASLMTLNMIDAGPYRRIRQVMAQIENKRLALKEAGYKRARAKLRMREAGLRIKEIAVSERPALVLEREQLYLRINKIESDLADGQVYIEATIKEIGAYLERYEQLLKHHNIRPDWDEADFEAAEIDHHITAIFRLALRDRMAGTCNQGTMEYMEQYGIEPLMAYRHCDQFLHHINARMSKGERIDITARHKFYQSMVGTFKDSYKAALAWVGLDGAVFDQWLLRNEKEVESAGA